MKKSAEKILTARSEEKERKKKEEEKIKKIIAKESTPANMDQD